MVDTAAKITETAITSGSDNEAREFLFFNRERIIFDVTRNEMINTEILIIRRIRIFIIFL